MQVLIDFFTGFFDVLLGLGDFIVSFIEDIVYVIQLTGNFVLQIPNYFSWLPSAFVSLIVTIFSIVVIYKVLGREG